MLHDLNNPLTAIRILAEMIREQIADPEMRQDIVDILEAADQASALTDGMAALVRLDGPEEDYTWFPIDLVAVLRDTVDRPALRRHVRLDLPQEIQLGGDRNALLRAFTDILVNAKRLSEGQSITVLATENEAMVEVRVRHPIAEIHPQLRDRLFEPYGAVELRQNRIPVSAAGLVYARRVVDAHGGSLTFDVAPGGPVDLVVSLRR